MTVIDRITKLYQEMLQDDTIHIIQFQTFEPVREIRVKEATMVLGIEIDSSILDFYTTTNGLQLWWVSTTEHFYEKEFYTNLAQQDLGFKAPLYNEYQLTGCINIIPFENIFVPKLNALESSKIGQIIWSDFLCNYATYDQEIRYLDRRYNEGIFREYIRPFDICSHFSQVVFFLEREAPYLKVCIISNQWNEIVDTVVTNFEAYLNFLIATKGNINARFQFYVVSEYAFQHRNTLINPPSTFLENFNFDL